MFDHPVSWRDIILVAGGFFLLYKGTHEIHGEIEGEEESPKEASIASSFASVIVQIIIIDLVFSIDSIVTAIGMAQDIAVVVAAVVAAMIVMYIASGPVSSFIAAYPTTKVLALAFLLLIGMALVADGIGFHIPRGYVYFAMAFAAGVEAVNVIASRRRKRRG